MTCSQKTERRRCPQFLALMVLLQWSAVFGCGYEFELAEEERREITTTTDIADEDTSSGDSSEPSSDHGQDSSSGSGSQEDPTSISTGNESDDSSSTGSGLHPCPEEIEFVHQSAILTDLAVGKKPGTQFLDTCPQGQVIVGFHGFLMDFTTALVHGKVQAICASLSLSALKDQCKVKTHTEKALPIRGSGGDIEWTRTCPDNEVVVGFGAKTGMDIDRLTFFCAPLLIENEGESYSFERGSMSELNPVGGPGGGTLIGLISCPDNTVARGQNIYSYSLVSAFGLECHRLSTH